jgi:hypothetical protein
MACYQPGQATWRVGSKVYVCWSVVGTIHRRPPLAPPPPCVLTSTQWFNVNESIKVLNLKWNIFLIQRLMICKIVGHVSQDELNSTTSLQYILYNTI